MRVDENQMAGRSQNELEAGEDQIQMDGLMSGDLGKLGNKDGG